MEGGALKQGRERGGDPVTVGLKEDRQVGDILSGRIVRDEEGPEFPGQESGALGAFADHVDNLIPGERPGPAKEGFLRGIEFPRNETEGPAFLINPVTRESPRRLLDVLFGVMPLPQGKEFHHLAGKVLVRMLPSALLKIEPANHRRISGDLLQDRGEVAQCVPPEEGVLGHHQPGEVHLLVARCKMTVPEQCQFLAERGARVAEPVEPPDPKIGDGPVIGLPKLPLHLAAGKFVGSVLDPPLEHHACSRIHETGKRIEIVVLVRIGQRGHGLLQAKGDQGIDFARGTSEAGTVQKVRCRGAVPESFREGGKHLSH